MMMEFGHRTVIHRPNKALAFSTAKMSSSKSLKPIFVKNNNGIFMIESHQKGQVIYEEIIICLNFGVNMWNRKMCFMTTWLDRELFRTRAIVYIKTSFIIIAIIYRTETRPKNMTMFTEYYFCLVYYS